MTDYEVEAKLFIDSKGTTRGLRAVNKQLTKVDKAIGRINRRSLKINGGMRGGGRVGPGSSRGAGKGGRGSYLGVGMGMMGGMAMARGLTNQVSQASKFRKEMETGQLSLATMYNLVDGNSMADAFGRAKNQMIQMNRLAARAPGGAQDMMAIQSRLYGPMANLGATQAEIDRMTTGAAVAGKAMGIQDTGALGRDVEEMLTGRTGKRTTKLFAIASSWGLINKDAKEFNRLSPAKRLEEVQRLLLLFEKHGQRMAKTWDGASEAFGGWMKIIRDMTVTGLFSELGEQLYKLNGFLDDNLKKISAYARLISNAGAGAISGLATMGSQVFSGASRSGPTAYGMGALGTQGAGTLVTGSIMATVGQIMSMMGVSLAALAPFLMSAAFAFSVIQGVLEGLMSNGWAEWMGTVMGMFMSAMTGVASAFQGIGKFVAGAVRLVRSFLIEGMGLNKILAYLSVGIQMLGEVMAVTAESFGSFFNVMTNGKKSAKESALEMAIFTAQLKMTAAEVVMGLGQLLGDVLIGALHDIYSFFGQTEKVHKLALLRANITTASMQAATRILGSIDADSWKRGDETKKPDKKPPGSSAGKGTASTEVNIQRMTVNQEFKGKADPDRIVAAFVKGVTDQATKPIRSPNDFPVGG